MSTVFEKLLSGEWPCAKVYEDDRVFAFMDAGQVNDGHVIVATKQPFETLLDMDEDTAAALMRAAWKIARAVQAAFEPEGITVLQANRPAGWQTVPHAHLHVLPRYDGRRRGPHLAAQGAGPGAPARTGRANPGLTGVVWPGLRL
jgi:histidine triad (HIT) family protein